MNVRKSLFSDMLCTSKGQLFSQEETCPLCFGHDLCEDVSAGFLSLATDTPQAVHGAAIYSAHLGDMQKLSVKVRIMRLKIH